MRALRHALVVLLVAAAAAGTARADLFAVLPDAAAPNPPGRVTLSADLLRPPPAPSLRDRDRLQRLWRAAGETYDVPWSVLAAINAIESDFGRNMGPSSAGAIGWMQFMPSTWERWGVDADGSGVADPWNAEDAVYSAARYLAAAGASHDIARAVFAYNHAGWYVDRVLRLAAVVEAEGTQLIFGLDRLAVSLAAARGRLAAASVELERAKAAREPALRATSAAAVQAARAARAAREARIGQLTADAERARAEVKRLEAVTAGAAFSPATSAALGAPVLVGGYVFPVGGGPKVVSIATVRLGDPAVSIVAPAGSPVYAFAAGRVERVWGADAPRCGVGLLLRSDSGRGWVFCHLALIDAAVVVGGRVSPGAPLGLVGATGDVTGPQLGLLLEHTDSWPQGEAWFTAFAGRAFTWQGPGTVAGPAAA